MNNILKITFTSCGLLLLISVATAKAPYIELASLLYSGTQKQCKTDSINALKLAGFELKSGTYEDVDTVGVHGDLKGVVSCTNHDTGQIIIIMAGNNYQFAVKKLRAVTDELR